MAHNRLRFAGLGKVMVERQASYLIAAEPKVAAYDQPVETRGTISLIEAAKRCGAPPKMFISLMEQHDWLMRRGS